MNPSGQGEAADAKHEEERRSLLAFLDKESKRCQQRRRKLFGAHDKHYRYVGRTLEAVEGNWALALSGGGIRSSTFCLGVLQGLAKPLGACAPFPAGDRREPELDSLLPRFDYVSSVSGGGFAAGFYQTLFAPKQVSPPTTPPSGFFRKVGNFLRFTRAQQQPAGSPANAMSALPTAAAVNRVVAQEPPGRVNSGVTPTPLAWLRENGRYLAPSGSGDMSYAFALSIRNWIGLHWVIGVVLMFLGSILALIEIYRRQIACIPLHSWWLPPLVVALVWLLPTTGAHWIARTGGTKQRLSLLGLRVLCVMVCGVVLLGVGLAASPPTHWGCSTGPSSKVGEAWKFYTTCLGAVLLLATLWVSGAWLASLRTRSIAQLSVTLTRCFMYGMWVLGALLLLEVVIALAWKLLDHLPYHPLAGAGTGAGVLAAAYRTATKLLPRVQGPRNGRETMSGLSSRALNLGLAVLAVALLLGIAVFWTSLAFWLVNPCILPNHIWACPGNTTDETNNACVLVVLTGLSALAIAQWPSILNISSYHYFYSARLTRAYLGAANPNRTTAPPGPMAKATTTSTAEPEPGDFVDYSCYHKNPAAPLHLINITSNQTIDPCEQLVQRDRKGLPFTLLPALDPHHAGPVNVSIGDRHQCVAKDGASLTMGDWLAISGAAVSSGMGRQTSFGASICVTFANARVGRWWPQDANDRFLARIFPTYAYLWSEITGKFFGARRKYLYLTDGGHFENTGTYEVLRRVQHPTTAIRFILMCDCGADREYRYDDLSNLVRLARIDFGLEIEVDRGVAQPPSVLASVFGTPDSMGAADPERLDDRCALLLNVRKDNNVLAKIIVIKPRLIRCASSDLLGYFRNNPVFPQEPTSDQFFDEQQWESYRKLGLECCKMVLGLGAPLWQTVLR